MAFSSGTFTFTSNSFAPSPVTGTTISSSAAASTWTELATALSTCLLKDGTQTVTANIQMSSFKLTGLAAGTANGNSVRYEQIIGVVTTAGDVVYATAAGTYARLGIGTARQYLRVNSGATAPEWGSGTTLGTEQASTSGTSIDFTSIPAGVRRITVMFAGVSTNGTSGVIIQLGDSGGVETSGYLGALSTLTDGAAVAVANLTTGHPVTNGTGGAGAILHGAVTFTLENSSAFTWIGVGTVAQSDTTKIYNSASSKSTSAELDRVRITTAGGTDTFDAGVINISYEF